MHFASLLTPAQAAFLTTLLPPRLSFQPHPHKRPHVPKPMDSAFTSDFALRPSQPNTSHCSLPNTLKTSERGVRAQEEEKDSPAVLNQSTVSKQPDQQGAGGQPREEQIMTAFLLRLNMSSSAWPFRMPVDPVAQSLPGYYQKMKEPMDLKTIDGKIKAHQYPSQKQFDADIRKIIANSYAFNSQDSIYYSLTKQFQNDYDLLWGEYRRHPEAFLPDHHDCQQKQQPKEPEMVPNEETPKKRGKRGKSQTKKMTESVPEPITFKVSTPFQPAAKSARSMSCLSFKQRQKWFQKIQDLSQTGIRSLVKIIQGESVRGEWEELQIDLAELEEERFLKLEAFLTEQD